MTGSDNLVVDASAVVTLLIDSYGKGKWASEQIRGRRLFAPELLYFEATNILRRERRKELIDETMATSAYQDLLDLPIHIEPFSTLARRIWRLRGSVTAYDAAYVAVAEWRRAPLLTTDHRLTRSNGPKCEFITPPMS